MGKYRKLFLCLALSVVVGCGVVAYFRAATPQPQPVLRLVFGSKNCPVDGLGGIDFPSKGFNRASFATGQDGKFYVLTSKQNTTEKEPIIHILTAGAGNNIKRAVPLRRQDGRSMRYLCYFLSVSPMGRRWWTARRPHESEADLKEGSTPKAILSIHDESGKALQEWVLTEAIDDIQLVQAVGEDQVYVADTAHHVWVYKAGRKLPQEFAQSINPGQMVTPNGQIWDAYPRTDGTTEVSVMALGSSPRSFTTFRRSPKEFFPSLFWHEPKVGLFVFEYLKAEAGIRDDRAKAVYRITADGVVHKLFETPDVLKAKAGEQVRTGQLLKADANFVWMEVEYFKGSKPTEYQIVKIPYR